MSGFFSECCVSSFVWRLASVASVETGQKECPVVVEGTGPPDRTQVRLFVYLFNNKCHIVHIFQRDKIELILQVVGYLIAGHKCCIDNIIFQSDITVIKLATCNTATPKLFTVKFKFCVCQSCVYSNFFASLLDAFYYKDYDQLRLHSTFNSNHNYILYMCTT